MKTQKLTSQAELAHLLNRSKTTIWRWIKDGILPQPVRINGIVIGWKPDDIEYWLKQNMKG